MSRYAKSTTVSMDRSKAEIEKTLLRYGADQFMYGLKEERAVIGFRMNNRFIRFTLLLPDKNGEEFNRTRTGRVRRSVERKKWFFEQGSRQRWRALALVIKAKLEAVDSKIAEFETEFLGQIVMPDGKTVAEHVVPKIEGTYKSGKVPVLLLE